MDRERIIEVLRGLMPVLRERYAVAELGIFGSVARGTADEKSDIDVLVRFEPDARVTLMTLAGIKCDLEDALGREIDLVEDHKGLQPRFRLTVERDLIRVA